MLQSALRGTGICCETAADDLVARYLGGVFPKNPLEVPGLQKEWLTIAGSAAIADTLRAESGSVIPLDVWPGRCSRTATTPARTSESLDTKTAPREAGYEDTVGLSRDHHRAER